MFSHFFSFFFNDTATTEIYTLSLHDALPISSLTNARRIIKKFCYKIITNRADKNKKCSKKWRTGRDSNPRPDRKSTRLNSSHVRISYAVFCLKKKKKPNNSNKSNKNMKRCTI